MSGVPGNNYFTVQGFGNPVPAAYGGERAGSRPSISHDRRSTEVSNLATVVNNATRMNMNFANTNESDEKKKRLSGAARRQRAKLLRGMELSRHTFYSADEGSSVAKRARFEVPQQMDFMDSAPPPPRWFSGNESDAQYRSQQEAKQASTVTASQSNSMKFVSSDRRESTRWSGGDGGARSSGRSQETKQPRSNPTHNIHHSSGNASHMSNSQKSQQSKSTTQPRGFLWNDTSSPSNISSVTGNNHNSGANASHVGSSQKSQSRSTAQPHVNLWNDASVSSSYAAHNIRDLGQKPQSNRSTAQPQVNPRNDTSFLAGISSRSSRWMGESEFLTHFGSNQRVNPTRSEASPQVTQSVDSTRWKGVNESASNVGVSRGGGQPRITTSHLTGKVSATCPSSSSRLKGGVPVESNLKTYTPTVSRTTESIQWASEKRKFFVIDAAVPSGKIEKHRQPLVEKAWNDALLNLILASRDGSPFQIQSCYFLRDVYVVKLASQRGVGALKDMVEKLPQLWKGAKLRFVTQIPEVKIQKVTMMLRGPSAQLPTDTILAMIGKQNVGLNVNKWKLSSRKELEEGCLFLVILDDESRNTLIRNKGRAFLLSSTVTFRVNKKPLGYEASKSADARPNKTVNKTVGTNKTPNAMLHHGSNIPVKIGQSVQIKNNPHEEVKKTPYVSAAKNSASIGASSSSSSAIAKTQVQLQRAGVVVPMNSDQKSVASTNKQLQVEPNKDTSKVTRSQYRAAVNICRRLSGKANLPKKAIESLAWAKKTIEKAKENAPGNNASGVRQQQVPAVKLEQPSPSKSADIKIVTEISTCKIKPQPPSDIAASRKNNWDEKEVIEIVDEDEIVEPKLITDIGEPGKESNPIVSTEPNAEKVDCQNLNEEILPAHSLVAPPSDVMPVNITDFEEKDTKADDTNYLLSTKPTNSESITEGTACKTDETLADTVATSNTSNAVSTAQTSTETLPITVSIPTPDNQSTEIDGISYSSTMSTSNIDCTASSKSNLTDASSDIKDKEICTEAFDGDTNKADDALATTATSNTEAVMHVESESTAEPSTEVLPITVSTPTPDNQSTEVDSEAYSSTASASNRDCMASPATSITDASSNVKDTKEICAEVCDGDANKAEEPFVTAASSNTEVVLHVEPESAAQSSTETLPITISTRTPDNQSTEVDDEAYSSTASASNGGSAASPATNMADACSDIKDIKEICAEATEGALSPAEEK